MTHAEIVTLALGWMLRFAPVESAPQMPGHEETAEETRARYASIASAIADACESSKTQRSCTALLVAIGTGESRFARDADVGPCYRGKGYESRCDAGLAASVWQVHAHGRDANGEPVTVAKLFASRSLAAKTVLRVARWSLQRCTHLPAQDRLAGLAGSCRASSSARARYRLWRTIEATEVR